jgi:anhydro-N-acetylmuramic acid kinase
LKRLFEIARRRDRLVVGLNSGTSADGIDAALVRFETRAEGEAPARPELLAFRWTPYADDLRAFLLRAPDLSCEEVCRANVRVAEAFADAARAVVADGSFAFDDVALIGSHGQTVCHLPNKSSGSTLQIGDLDVLAARLGKVVVGDFRAADVASGGAGAPLMPYLDQRLFGGEEGTIVLNLGGIAALTAPSPRVEDVLAFDVGPCNVVLDALAHALLGAGVRFDRGGEGAARGRIRDDLLARLLAHPYFEKAPPKTTGRESFGAAYVARLLDESKAAKIPLVDLLATHTALIGASIGAAADAFLPGGRPSVRRVLCGGGGVRNATLIEGIRRAFPKATTRALNAADGATAESKEAVLFALLAEDRIAGRATSLPWVTGARSAVSLGKIAGG